MQKMNYTISKMICTNCGQEGIPIPRKVSKVREKGHLKKLYCIHCKDYYNHKEIRTDAENVRLLKEIV